MTQLVTAAEMKACDQFTIQEIGVPSMVLMEHAALSALDTLEQSYDLSNTLILCGSGNNGGDGYALARLLHLKGYTVSIAELGTTTPSAENQQQQKICTFYQIPTFTRVPDLFGVTTIVDAIFGIGLDRTISDELIEMVTLINESGIDVLALDIPSGIHADTGAVMGAAIEAKQTLTFQFNKVGMTIDPGLACAGEILIADIGISDQPLTTE
ncbi:YjeF family domain-containing protein [Enterococcus canis]|uniref:NAD(P)H-hydrate epimerase n=1 Tax=Enterococcus canis TaxID=214095 RepID=A0A1L8RI21_9ENTE|nr:NAD(P)H-hydrate epimerase [Enterococcus canis]OJG19418.1 YjeF family domain-containing protein [Enterococcus canis]